MKLRRWATSITFCGALLSVSVLLAPAAHAFTSYSESDRSPKYGWGHGLFYNPTAGIREIDVCDDGPADGLRAVGILEAAGVRYQVHAAGGTGSCETKDLISSLPGGVDYKWRVCLRNGASGANVYCDEWQHGFVY